MINHGLRWEWQYFDATLPAGLTHSLNTRTLLKGREKKKRSTKCSDLPAKAEYKVGIRKGNEPLVENRGSRVSADLFGGG